MRAPILPPTAIRLVMAMGAGIAGHLWLAPATWAAQTAPAAQGLSSAVIQKTVRAKYAELRQCYEDLDDQPPMQVEMHFTIGPDGKVTTGYVESVVRPQMAPCVERAMFSLVFPKPAGGDVSVVYALNFAP